MLRSRHLAAALALARLAAPARGALVLGVLAVSLVIRGAPGEAAAVPPNIVVITGEDMTASLVEQMPSIKSLIRDKGATFTHAYANVPLCQPARATMLSGRYDQNTGAVDNSAASYQRFVSSGVEADSVAVWLRNASYRTGSSAST